MKNIIKALVLIYVLTGCHNIQTTSPLYDSGVSIELAKARKNGITNITYALTFDIPAQESAKIDGSLSVSLKLDSEKYNHPLIMDFKAEKSDIISITVNGKQSDYKFENEHIIIPSNYLENGINTIDIKFITGEQSLNRNKDYMYTLLVPDRARTLFPCFDQPDMKAMYHLTLTIPDQWEAVGNSPVIESVSNEGTKTIRFAPTEPLSSYLFSFVTGIFNVSEHQRGERRIKIYHRETEQQKTEQLPEIARQVFASLEWMEQYTGISYPFAKYDLILLPGFQYGGMEHTGATLYKNSTMLLPPNPTLEQELSRTKLIAHETAHMWFGDYVTMDWFSGVWIKEVFAGFFASKICRPLFPNVDFSIEELDLYTSAYSEDRTQGTTSIQQDLPNLRYAGLIYGNIIYQKSPIVMNMLYEKMGHEPFRAAIQEYLRTYAYSNASWDNLIDIMIKHQVAGTTDNLKQWSQYWIYGKGMPQITLNQSGADQSRQIVAKDTVDGYIIPNLDGKYYGYIKLDQETLDYILENLYTAKLSKTGVAKKSLLITLNENWLQGDLDGDKFVQALCGYIDKEKDPQLFPTLLGYVSNVCRKQGQDSISTQQMIILEFAEMALWDYVSKNGKYATQALRTLNAIAESPEQLTEIYNIWASESSKFTSLKLSQRDYVQMAYQLAIKMPLVMGGTAPATAEQIIETQKKRLTQRDEIREFEFIARGTVADTTQLDNLFNSLLSAENRAIEPWTQSLLGLLNHPLRQKHALKYIAPALDAMPDVQATGDIFFPRGWIGAVLGGHNSPEAAKSVKDYIESHPEMLPLLRNKVMQAAYHLY